MTAGWFREYLYEELLKVLDTEPKTLKSWGPMGALA